MPDAARPDAADPAPIFIWEQVIPRRTMLYLPKHVGLDLYGFMIDGEVSVLADDIPGKDKQKRLWQQDAVRAPGVGVNIYAKEPTRILLAAVSTSGEPVAKALVGLPARDVSWKKRSSMITSLEFGKRTPVSWGGGAYHARYGIEPDGDSPSASMTLLLASKDASIAENVHDKEWEALAILKGDGDMIVKGVRRKLEPGSIWAVPPGTPHAFQPSGSSPMLAVQFFVGPGPEQRYKRLASP